MKKNIFIILLLMSAVSFCFADDIISPVTESRIIDLEKRIAVLEKFILPLMDSVDSVESQSMPVPTVDEKSVIGIELLELSYHESNASNDYANDYSDWISLIFELENNCEKDTKAIKGAVVFSDLFDEEWMRIGLTVNEAIPSGDSFIWRGSIDYNMFNDMHQRLKNTGVDEVLIFYDVSQIIFTDGERVSFE